MQERIAQLQAEVAIFRGVAHLYNAFIEIDGKGVPPIDVEMMMPGKRTSQDESWPILAIVADRRYHGNAKVEGKKCLIRK